MQGGLIGSGASVLSHRFVINADLTHQIIAADTDLPQLHARPKLFQRRCRYPSSQAVGAGEPHGPPPSANIRKRHAEVRLRRRNRSHACGRVEAHPQSTQNTNRRRPSEGSGPPHRIKGTTAFAQSCAQGQRSAVHPTQNIRCSPSPIPRLYDALAPQDAAMQTRSSHSHPSPPS